MDTARIEKVLGKSVDMKRAVDAITKAVEGSFGANTTSIKRSDVIDRFNLCLKILGSLRNDLKWSLIRAYDMLPQYLRCELAGIAYDPSNAHTMWSPEANPPNV